jgi:hypothetical protein
MTKEKTHWLQSPNKNYLGHWDLPNGEDIIVTIKSAEWEEVKNPITRTSEAKRVIRFEENYEWIKPFICNEINAQTICKSTGKKFMEDSAGKKIKIGVGSTKVKGEEVDCLRVRKVNHIDLEPTTITQEQGLELIELAKVANKDMQEICKAMKINSIIDLPANKFAGVKKRLEGLVNANS